MYLSTMRAGDTARAGTAGQRLRHGRVPGTVVALGIVSFVTDASAEMITAVLPMYLIYGLGLGYLQLGALDGLYTGATALLRLAGGYAADRLNRPKAVAIAGYGVSALTRLGLPVAGGSLAGISTCVAIDRAGKGVRTAPRDAMITLATPAKNLGRAFGVHRALDTAGALLGPLIAFGLLSLLPGDYNAVFMVSFCLGTIGVLVLVFFVRQPHREAARRAATSLKAGVRVALRPGVRSLVVAAALLGLMTVGDMFLYVALQRQADLPTAVLPLLPLGTAGTFMLAAIPLGRFADRFGRWRMFLAAHVLLAGAYLLVAGGIKGWVVAGAVLLLHGLFYAASDGVLMASAGLMVPAELRATGLAVVQTAQALARAVGAVGFGVATAAAGARPAFGAFAVLLVVGVLLIARTRGRS
ncbi:MFS transporter [Kribbella antibiotica]|uniref:MFS transporter n=1 Tax=Kribbella antibiotica TaxID=190195 RepID=A0A4R4ZPQ1_9ACTN|nr:MFS transporter [Kribbella antibiotica]TDD60250.1 MFS transporter [Kribbella antibiotica]